MIKTFFLRGLPEGIVGDSEVKANSIDNLLNKYPALNDIKSRLNIGVIKGGFDPNLCKFLKPIELNFEISFEQYCNLNDSGSIQLVDSRNKVVTKDDITNSRYISIMNHESCDG